MDGCFYHVTPAFLIGSDVDVQQGPFAPWALPHFIATTDLAVTVSPSIDFPVDAGYTIELLHRFLDGARTVSPVARHALVTVLSLTTPTECRAASVRLRRAMLPSPQTRKLGLRGFLFRGHLGFTYVTAR